MRRGELRRRLAGVNLLDLAPARAAEWREEEGRAVLERPRPSAPVWRRPASWLAYLATVKQLRLDEAGTFVWRRLDGRSRLREIAAAMRVEMGAAYEPTEERIAMLVKLLRREEMVRYPAIEGSGEASAPGGGA